MLVPEIEEKHCIFYIHIYIQCLQCTVPMYIKCQQNARAQNRIFRFAHEDIPEYIYKYM